MDKIKLGIYEKATPESLSWKERFSEAKKAGYDFLEISIDETEKRLSRIYDRKEIKNILRDASDSVGIKVETMCLSGHRKFPLGSSAPEILARGIEIIRKAIEFSDDIGIKIIQLAGYDVYYETSTEDTRKRFEENLIKSTELAASYGIILALETMETPFCNTIKKAMNFVDKVNSPYLGVYPDIGNVSNATDDVVGDIYSGKGHIFAAHLKETKPGIFRNLRYGEGCVDFESATKALLETGVRRFNAEFWYNGEEDWQNELSRANMFLRKFIKEG